MKSWFRLNGRGGLRVALAVCALLAAQVVWALDLNTATRSQLERLPRIGVDRAERILNARAAGPFLSWEDFHRRVPGFGVKTIQFLQEQGVTIEAVPSAGAAMSAPASAAP